MLNQISGKTTPFPKVSVQDNPLKLFRTYLKQIRLSLIW